jgi:DNA-binding NarL/FixJ family response regulator
VLRRLAGSPVPTARSSVFVGLTEREREVLEYSVLGLSRTDIAGELGVSVNTVRTHVQHILTKLRVHTTLEAVTLVLRERAAGE